MPTTDRRLFVGISAGFLAVLLVAPAAAEAQVFDADRGGDGTAGAGPTAAGGDGAAGAGPNTPRGLLVPAGETIRDIDTIIETLDRQAPVSAIAFSPDGTLIASGSEDHVVRVWQPASGRLVRRLEGHVSAVTAVAFSPDGSVIASASNDRTVRLWEARSGRLLRILQGHVYHVYAIAFDPHRSWLATASWDRTIQLWDVKSGELVKKLRGHGAAIRAIDFSRDGTLLASGSDDQTVRLWNVDTGQELKLLAGHTGPVNAVRFRPDGEWLFSGSADHSVRTWRVPDGTVLRKVGDCGAPVRALAVSRDGQMLGGGCGDSGAVLWDIATGTELRRSHRHGAETRAIAFSPDGRMVATGGDDAAIVVEDVATGRVVVSLSANLAPHQAVAFSPDGSMLASAARDRRVLVWQDVGDHKILSRVLVGEQGTMRGLAFSPDGKALAAGDGRKVVLWDLVGDGLVRTLTGHESAVTALVFTPDGRTLASAADDGNVRLWNLKKEDAAKVLKGHRAPVRALAVSPDGSMLASASDDESVRVWDAATGRNRALLGGHSGPVTSVAFSSDGKYLFAGTQGRTIEVWLPAKGTQLKGMRKELPASVVALASLGQHIVAASSDGLLSLWDLAGKGPLEQSTVPTEAPSALAAGPGGAIFASASRDGRLRIWDGKTLERRWSLAGNSRARWFACNDERRCWRNDDGTLLGRFDEQGDLAPVSPSDPAHETALVAMVDRSKLGDPINLLEGRTVPIPIRIENRGGQPAYWVNVAQSILHSATNRGALLLIPPPTIAVLGPGASANVVCEVSALAEYEDPRPHSESLRLSITSASAKALSLELPVWIDTPHLQLRHLELLRGPNKAVVASLTEVFMAELEPVLLQGRLRLEGREPANIAPVALEQPFIGQDLALAFPLPEGTALDRRSRATFTVRKSTHPVHVWTFTHLPVRIPRPLWSWALLVGCLLGLGFVIWRARLYARARPVGRAGKRLSRLGVAVLLGLGKVLIALVRIRSTVRSLGARLQRRGIAVTFFRLQPETQCSHFARQLGASWSPIAGTHQPVFELHLGPEVQLNVERCLLALPTGDAEATALTELAGLDEGQNGITVVLSDVSRSELTAHLDASRRPVVMSTAVMNRVLRAPQPALAFAQVVSEQIDRATISLYRSAVSNGQRRPFHGRRSELRRLEADPRRNYVIVGPDGIGKTSLLDEIYRRFLGHPTVECHYLSLADGDLTAALADALGMPGEPLLDVLLERLADAPKGKRVVVLCDDVDAWVTLDGAHGGAQLQTLALLNQEHPCSFVLAGFLGLLYAARAQRGRKPFGEVVKLETLDAESCVELVTEPMAALNVHYAKTDLIDHILEQSAGMPSLLVAICDQMLDRLQGDQRIIGRAEVESACKSEVVARAITAWRPRFGLSEPRLAPLDQTVLLAAVFKTRFTLEELQSALASLGVQATAAEIKRSAGRLVAACVFEHWLGYFHFRVPLFQTVMQEATLARMIAQLSPDQPA